jgi:hypothetical protein
MCFTLIGFAQKKTNLRANGYVKYLQTNQFIPDSVFFTDNLLHNRVNLALTSGKHFSAGLEFRNRVFYGETVKLTPNYADLVTDYDGVLPLEYAWVDEKGLVANTIVDRAWLQWSGKSWEARVGRQRINWGMNTVWNPNDWFNNFNYLDFDYEERPGSDAVLVSFFPGAMSRLSLAYKWASDDSNNVAAINYRFNYSTYDIQVLGGVYGNDFAAGLGWDGSIKSAGFKTEASFFIPRFHTEKNSGTLSLATQVDYSFSNGLYVMGSYLFNSAGARQPIPLTGFYNTLPSAKTLMPNRHTGFGMTMYAFSPIFSASMAGMYAFEVNWLILFPTLTYNIKNNWDMDLVGQFFASEQPMTSEFQNSGNGIFLRLKYSY